MDTITRQTTNDLTQILADAGRVLPALSALVEGIAFDLGGRGFVGPLKSLASIERKVRADYAGDVSRVVDVCRATIVLDSGANVAQALALLAERVKIVRLKDRFARPVGGYRDALVNVELDGHVCEVQVHVQAILDVKEIIHFAYEYVRVTACPVAGAWMEIAYDHAFAGNF